jgi:hypothetical protein
LKPWSKRPALIAGATLVVLTNALALGGVAWNRSGQMDSELKLGMQELRVARGGFNRESNGVMLNLVWRTPVRDEKDLAMWNSSGGGIPPWLDEAKMAELGFVVPDIKTYADLQRRRGTSRAVFLVLELDGPTRTAHLEQVRAKAADQIEKASTQPPEQAKRSIEQAQKWLDREENEFSRLFVVDAGLDREMLRLRYPDHAQHAIVQGRIVSAYGRNNNTNARLGYVQSIMTDTINVPYEYRSRLTAANNNRSPRDNASDELKGAAVTVAFGRRLEPWIVSIDRTDTR